MTRRRPLMLLLGVLAFGALCVPAGSAETTTTDLELEFRRPDGSHILLMFAIDAPSEEAALATALAAAAEIVPGATLVPPADQVSAQFAPWWWQWDTAELPVPVFYDPAGAIPSFTSADVEAALAAWSHVPGSSFQFAYAGGISAASHIQDGTIDGHNVVAWRALACTAGCVLGITTKTEAHETDVILNSNPEARLGAGDGSRDPQTVLVHEAGHMAGLEHSCPLFGCTESEMDAAMYFQYRGLKRSLQPDDVAGIRTLYPGQPASGSDTLQALTIDLPVGWSLIMLPAGPLELTMQRLACVDAVYAWDGAAWRHWIRGAHPLLQDIVTAGSGTPYWTHTSAACSYLFIVPA